MLSPNHSLRDQRLVIVGGGVAGLATACALAARGLPSIVLERTKTPGAIDRGDVIHHSSLTLLAGWQVPEAFREYRPLTVDLFRVLDHDGRVVFEFDLTRELSAPAPLTILPHPDIQRVLEIAARRTGLVEVRRPVACHDLLLQRGRVVGVRTDEGDVTSPVTILASGSHSALRDRYLGRRVYHEYRNSFLNVRARGVKGFGDAACYILGIEGLMILAPLPGNEIRLGFQLDGTPTRPTAAGVADLVRQRFRPIAADDIEIVDMHVYRISKSLNKSLWAPGAILVGDAAHTTHPAGGQGMNLAFQDAEVLGHCLEAVEYDVDRVDEAAARYSALRRQAIARVLRRTHLMGLMAAMRRPVAIRVRQALLGLLDRQPWCKRRIFERIVDVR